MNFDIYSIKINGATKTPLKIGNALVGLAGSAPDEIALDPSICK
jgi:hypothetical protein